MHTLDEVKAATAQLSSDEQFELFRWWIDSETFRQRQAAVLRSDIAKGLCDLDEGRYTSYDDATVMRLAEEVSVSGRNRRDASKA